MKIIFFLRHAKAGWNNMNLADFDRPLVDRGKNDAKKMGSYLLEKNIDLDVIFASPSRRTTETLELLDLQLEVKTNYLPSLYNASAQHILSIITTIDEEFNSVMIVGHNPSIHEVTEILTKSRLAEFPTCSMSIVEHKGSWNEVSISSGKLKEFIKSDQL